ncbi:MAG: helix-turn-helix domain-containing protein [Candidatus Paceibacteria bacterium]
MYIWHSIKRKEQRGLIMAITQACGVCLITHNEPDYDIILRKRQTACAFVFGRSVNLGGKEGGILFCLIINHGVWCSRETLLNFIDSDLEADERSIDTLITRLRRKLFPNNRSAALSFIAAGYRKGYRIPTRHQL